VGHVLLIDLGVFMFKVVKSGANRLDIELSGKLDGDNMKVVLDELLSSANGIRQGRILYRIEDFDIPTFGAMGVELSRLPELFKFIRKFDRIAVLVNKKWVKKASEIEGALIPGLKVKAFDLDEEAEAENWLSS
jgi:hypothetical protein